LQANNTKKIISFVVVKKKKCVFKVYQRNKTRNKTREKIEDLQQKKGKKLIYMYINIITLQYFLLIYVYINIMHIINNRALKYTFHRGKENFFLLIN
jgi:hypothetical protein